MPVRHVLLLALPLLSACDWNPSSSDPRGAWKSDENGTTLVFHDGGRFELLDEDGNSQFDTSADASVTWQAVTEIEPHQLYIIMRINDRTEKIPLGIYKIDGDKLVLREPTVYERTVGGISVGVSRYEMPSDFSGIVNVYTRQDR